MPLENYILFNQTVEAIRTAFWLMHQSQNFDYFSFHFSQLNIFHGMQEVLPDSRMGVDWISSGSYQINRVKVLNDAISHIRPKILGRISTFQFFTKKYQPALERTDSPVQDSVYMYQLNFKPASSECFTCCFQKFDRISFWPRVKEFWSQWYSLNSVTLLN